MTIRMIREVIHYFRHDKEEFCKKESQSASAAEQAYQGSMKSAVDVARNARSARSSADFLREVMKGKQSGTD